MLTANWGKQEADNLADLDLSGGSRFRLMEATKNHPEMGLQSLDGICRLTEGQLLGIDPIGRKTLVELKKALAKKGRHLASGTPLE